METGSFQGLHQAGVAAELWHTLKNIKLVIVFHIMLPYNFHTWYIIFAEYINIPPFEAVLGLHQVGVVVKVNHSLMICINKIMFSLAAGTTWLSAIRISYGCLWVFDEEEH